MAQYVRLGTTITVIGIVVLIAVMWSWGMSKSKDVQVFLNDHGTISKLDSRSPHFKELLATCEDALASSDAGRVLQLAVFSDTIKQIKGKEISIEVVYPEPREFQIGKAGFAKTLKVDHLLIPVSGKYAEASGEEYVTVFYGLGGYGSGPYTNSGEFQKRLKNLLGDMGYASSLPK